MWLEQISMIEGILGYQFDNKNLLEKAFTNESDDIDTNKSFALLGKNYLSFGILDILYNELAFVNDDNEFITNLDEESYLKLSKELISNDNINDFIINNELDKFLSNKDNKEETNCNLYYALLGSILIDCRSDTSLVKNVIIKTLDLYNNIGLKLDNDDNYIKRVSEWCLKKHEIDNEYHIYKTIEYKALNVINSDNSNFDIAVELAMPGVDGVFVAKERSITLAKLKVASIAYNYLKENDMLITYKDEVGTPDLERCINQLQELHDKGYIGEVEYKINQKYNSKGEVIWKCRCMLEGSNKTFTCEDISKKVAKRNTAFDMLKYVFSLEEK